MREYPVLFTTRELVAGNGFLAGVSACGRVLLVQEDSGSWWLHGVEPGAIAEGGASPLEADLQFITGLRNILYDMAAKTASFEEFEAAVRTFFHEVDEEDEALWKEALQRLRAGAPVEDAYVAALKRVPVSEATCKVEIQRLDAKPQTLSVSLNPRTDFAIPQLAAA